MSAFVYANGQYHLLAGNKIVKDAALLDMKATDKIVLNGVAYNLGIGSAIPGVPVVPDAPECTIEHDNGTEPATGTKWYVTPDGAGDMDGTSWANAASANMIHVILLQVESGDSVYFAEGDYTTDRTITLPSGVSLYGGFPSVNPTWATRDSFAHPTTWTASHSGAWLATKENIAGQVIDGFTLINYNDSVYDSANVTFRNGFVSGGNFAFGGMVDNSKIVVTDLNLGTASRCWINGETVLATQLTDCIVIGATSNVSNALRTDFYFGDTRVEDSADTVNVYGTRVTPVRVYLQGSTGCKVVFGKNYATSNYIFHGNSGSMTNCIATNCTCTSNSMSGIFHGNGISMTNCIATNCTCTGNGIGCIFYGSSGSMTNCIATNCTCTGNGIGCIFHGSGGSITNCTAVNCTSINATQSTSEISIVNSVIFYGSTTNCTAANCTSINECSSSGSNIYSSIFFLSITNCTAVNCTSINTSRNSYIFGRTSKNCTAVNCTAQNYIFYSSATNCTVVNCISKISTSNKKYIFSNGKNCLSWNNDGTEFEDHRELTTCAGSVYKPALTLILGTDNSITRFTNTGFAPVKGVQDVGACPSPIDDPTGYAEWLSAFGDWHPAADSFLLGAGTADEDVTTDADGVTRPDPPSIGAYEAKPA